ncbi:hypothetical protein PDQ04_18975 [Bacillus cereus]|nr:hypothetical protein [Bacillus cereus]
MTLSLPKKQYTVNKELLYSIEKLFRKEKIADHYMESIFAGINENEVKKVEAAKVELIIRNLEGKEDLVLRNANHSKVFEIIGTNQRFKTTSLIIMALILGFQFQEVDDYIASNQLLTRVTQMEKILFTKNDTEVIFSLDNKAHQLLFEKTREKIILILDDVTKEFQLDSKEFQNVVTGYKNFIMEKQIVDVQFVSKGRNFVGYVHTEIRNEFIYTLDIIKKQLKEVIEKGLKEKQEGERIKTFIQTESAITYVNKAKKIIEKMSIPPEIIDTLIKLENSGVQLDVNLGMLKDREIKIINSIDQQKKDLEKSISEKNLIEKEILKIIGEINNFAEGLPITFKINGIKEQIKKFQDKWEKIYTFENSNDLYAGKNGTIVPFKVTSEYFPSLTVDSISAYTDLSNTIVYVQNKLKVLSQKIREVEAVLLFNLDKLEDIDKKLKKQNLGILNLNQEMNDIKSYLQLVKQLSDHIKVEEISTVIEWVKKEGIIKKYDALVKCLERIDFKYENQSSEQLMEFLNSYERELNEIKQTHKKLFVFPKQVENLIKLPKILQDINATTNYLQIDFKGRELVNEITSASMENSVHEMVMDIFTKYMADRCGYYFEVKKNSVDVYKLKGYNFELQEFDIGLKKVSNSEGISGGTDSAMTVRSFASKVSSCKFGTMLLVDEWGDVGEALAMEVYKTFDDLETFGLGVFVKVDHNINNPKMVAVKDDVYV